MIPLILGLTAYGVSAHEHRKVGEYAVVVGWIVEPAFEGEKNGIDFRVSRGADDGVPVEGLEESVKVEVTHASTSISRSFELRGLYRQPGRYTAHVIPTAPGAYRFRFFGTIRGATIDETFVSSSLGGGFNDVASSAEIQFPQRLSEARELEAAIRGAREQAVDANDRVSSASVLATVALVVAAASMGISALLALRKRR
jgi:hypothetical protein